jgi:hypothetical protein
MGDGVVEEKIQKARQIMVLLCDNREPKDVLMTEAGKDMDLMLRALLLPLVVLDQTVKHKLAQSKLTKL